MQKYIIYILVTLITFITLIIVKGTGKDNLHPSQIYNRAITKVEGDYKNGNIKSNKTYRIFRSFRK